MKKQLLTAFALAFMIFSHAEARRGGHGFHRQIFKQLNLSDEQKNKLKEIRSGQKEHMKALRTNKRELREKFHEAIRSNKPEAELRKLHGELQAARNTFHTARFERLLSIRKILTPEQRIQFHELRRHHKRQRRGMRRGMQHGMRPPQTEDDDEEMGDF